MRLHGRGSEIFIRVSPSVSTTPHPAVLVQWSAFFHMFAWFPRHEPSHQQSVICSGMGCFWLFMHQPFFALEHVPVHLDPIVLQGQLLAHPVAFVQSQHGWPVLAVLVPLCHSVSMITVPVAFVVRALWSGFGFSLAPFFVTFRGLGHVVPSCSGSRGGAWRPTATFSGM